MYSTVLHCIKNSHKIIWKRHSTSQIDTPKLNNSKKSLHDVLYSTTVYPSTVYKITIKKPLWKVYIHLQITLHH
jgi:hypothetical protein